MVTYEIIESVDDVYNLKEQWESLLETAPHTPFQEWAWHYSWWKNVGKIIDQRPIFMTVWDGNNVKLIIPLCISPEKGVLQWSAAEVSDYCDIVVSKNNLSLFGPAFKKIKSKYSNCSVVMKQIRDDSYVYSGLGKFNKFTIQEDILCPAVNIDGERYEKWLKTLDKHILKDSSRRMRRLSEMGTVHLKEISDENELYKFVQKLILDKKAWLRRRKKENIICTTEGENFIIEALLSMNNKRISHLTVLQCGNKEIARNINFIQKGVYYYYIGAWDYSWKLFSPGRMLMLELIRFAHHNKLIEFDLLRGDEEYKQSVASFNRILVRFEMKKSKRNLLGVMSNFVKSLHSKTN